MCNKSITIFIGRQQLNEQDIRNNYYQVQLDPAVYNTSEPVQNTPDPVYNTLDHDIQPDPPHYSVISTAYNTTPQYSTIDTVPTSQYSTIDDSAVDSTVVVKDGHKVTVTVKGEGSTDDH